MEGRETDPSSQNLPPAVVALARRLTEVPWVTDLWVAGSLATGDYVPGVSDLDLVALTDGPVDPGRVAVLRRMHRELDRGSAAGACLGCVYVASEALDDPARAHPTWTHGRLVQRILSGITRAELVRAGVTVLGRLPREVLPPMSDDAVRAAGLAEVSGYWSWAARRPWLWLDPALADLGLTSMSRARHTASTGQLLSKTSAIEGVRPLWLREQVRARRQGRQVQSPRLRTAWIAWQDARATCRSLCQET